MKKMIRRLTKDTERLYRNICFTHEPFCYIFPAFKQIQDRYNELSPFEVWIAAIDFSNRLMEMAEPTLQIKYEIEELNEERLTDHSVFLVELAALHRLAPMRKKQPKAVEIITLLMPYVMDYPLYREMMREISEKEDEQRLKGNRISLLEYELKDIDANDYASQKEGMDAFVDVVIQTDVDTIKGVCAVFSDFNDQHEHRFQPQLERLRNAWHAKSIYHIDQRIDSVNEMTIFKDNSTQARIELQNGASMDSISKYIANVSSTKKLT